MAPVTRAMARAQQHLPNGQVPPAPTPTKPSKKKVVKPAKVTIPVGVKKAAPAKNKRGKTRKTAQKKDQCAVPAVEIGREREDELGATPEVNVPPTYVPRSPTQNTQHGQIGFLDDELWASGALDIGAARLPTLSNAIHDIWEKDNFDFPSESFEECDRVYELLAPSLRLASRWLTHIDYRSFWTDLLYGEIRVSDIDGVLPTIIKADRSKAKFVLPAFRELSGSALFTFESYADTWMNTSTRGQLTTTLHGSFFDDSVPQNDTTVSERLRFLFFLAVNLVHEIAHRIFQERWHTEQPGVPLPRRDPAIVSKETEDTHDELGIAWEQYMFGGRILVTNFESSAMATLGLVRFPVDMIQGDPFSDPQRRIAPVAVEWINNLFSEQWWTDKKKNLERMPGYIQLTPLRATVPYTTDSSVFRDNSYDIRDDETEREANMVRGHWLPPP